MPAVNDVGKPCAGEPHARIDGRELETELRSGHGHGEEQPHGKPCGTHGSATYRRSNATAPAPDPPSSLVGELLPAAGQPRVFTSSFDHWFSGCRNEERCP